MKDKDKEKEKSSCGVQVVAIEQIKYKAVPVEVMDDPPKRKKRPDPPMEMPNYPMPQPNEMSPYGPEIGPGMKEYTTMTNSMDVSGLLDEMIMEQQAKKQPPTTAPYTTTTPTTPTTTTTTTTTTPKPQITPQPAPQIYIMPMPVASPPVMKAMPINPYINQKSTFTMPPPPSYQSFHPMSALLPTPIPGIYSASQQAGMNQMYSQMMKQVPRMLPMLPAMIPVIGAMQYHATARPAPELPRPDPGRHVKNLSNPMAIDLRDENNVPILPEASTGGLKDGNESSAEDYDGEEDEEESAEPEPRRPVFGVRLRQPGSERVMLSMPSPVRLTGIQNEMLMNSGAAMPDAGAPAFTFAEMLQRPMPAVRRRFSTDFAFLNPPPPHYRKASIKRRFKPKANLNQRLNRNKHHHSRTFQDFGETVVERAPLSSLFESFSQKPDL